MFDMLMSVPIVSPFCWAIFYFLGALVHKYIYRAAIAAVFFTAFGMSPAGARNDTLEMTIADALATPDAQQKLDGSVKFFFGDTAHPAVVHSFGYLATNQKTNSVNKSAKRACEWAFLSALLRFQKRAEQLGANAVVDIHSYYDKHDVSSNVSFECHDGFLLTGVALRGNFVRIAGQ